MTQLPNPDAPDPDAPYPDASDADAPDADAPSPDAPSPDAPDPDGPNPDGPNPDARSPDAPDPDAPSPDPPHATDPTPAVEVDVARTGGIAGITRRWSAQPPESEASEWISLIDRCPWSEAPAHAPMPDGFVWIIRATWSGADPRAAELPDDAVVGAWRELVDAVRDWSRRSGSPGPERPGR